jgi:CRISPR-associated protein Csh2
MKKNNRVYGLVGIGCKMSMWNADMSLGPKSTADDIFFGSDKALKYSIKNLWKNEGDKILYIKHRDNNYALLNLKQIYEKEFGTSLPDSKKDKEANIKVLKNILSCPDVRNFGATFAVEKINLGITGVVQVGQGLNIWENSNRTVIDIMSPFVNSTKDDATMTSLGTKNVVDEAHFLYPITVNPGNYCDLEEIIPEFEGYTEEDYAKLKDALLKCATALDTNAKAGCENEFALFVNCKEGSKLYLANLNSYVTMDENRQINIVKLQELLESVMDEIDSVEIYINDKILNLVKKDCDKYIVKNMYGETI